MDTIYLAGAEQVSNAAQTMAGAAKEMQRAAGNIDHSLMMHQRFLDDWLQRFESVLEQSSRPRSTIDPGPTAVEQRVLE